MGKSTQIFRIIPKDTKCYQKLPKIPKGSQCICLSVILTDSVYRKDKYNYPQVFLEECKNVVEEKNIISLLDY